MKKLFLHALGAGIYIVIVIFVVDALTSGTSEETLIIPITMLGLFVLSTAVMGFLFLSEPICLFMENKK
jgi:hypothetical protein